MASCFVCCEKFNKSIRLKIICPHDDCSFEACKTCVRQYLLSTTKDPHCMKCNKAWNQKFIIENTNRSFYDSVFKKHRKKLLLDTELSKMPETMTAAENYRNVKEHRVITSKLTEQISEVQKVLTSLKTERSKEYAIINDLAHGNNKSEERRKFIMPCPHNDCRGYLSTQYKCEICKLYTCPQCFEIIGHTKTDEHTCNEDNIKTAELIKKDTKPCPTCGVRIFKISGCDQMWCTECQAAFSWQTGKVDKGTVHNPHYYKHLQQVNNGTIPRNPGDVLCGGLCSYHQVRMRILNKVTTHDNKITTHELEIVLKLHRFISHITNYDLIISRNKVRDLANHETVRVQYINKEKSKEELATQVFRNDNLRKKYTEMLHLYELLSVVGIDTFSELCNSKRKGQEFLDEIMDQIQRYHGLRKYCNEQFAEIGIIFNHMVIQIDDNFVAKSIKIKSTKGNKSNMASCSTDPL